MKKLSFKEFHETDLPAKKGQNFGTGKHVL